MAARTGLSQQEAEQRVDQVVTQAKAAADQARKAASKMAFWMAAALLAGALAASSRRLKAGASATIEGSCLENAETSGASPGFFCEVEVPCRGPGMLRAADQ